VKKYVGVLCNAALVAAAIGCQLNGGNSLSNGDNSLSDVKIIPIIGSGNMAKSVASRNISVS